MTMTALDRAALKLATQHPEARRDWLRRAAAECDRRARRGGEHADLLQRAAARARAELQPPRSDL